MVIHCTNVIAEHSFFLLKNILPYLLPKIYFNKESVLLSKILISNGYASKLLSVTNEHLAYPIPPYRQFFIINVNCENSSSLLKKANQKKLFASPFHWLVYHQEQELQTLPTTMFFKLAILVDSDFNIAKLHSNGNVSVRKFFRKHPNNEEFSIEEFGNWNKKLGFMKCKNFESSVARRRKNLGVVLNTSIVITHNDSLNHLTDKRDKHIDSIAKVDYVLVLVLASIYNITLRFSVKDTWGYKNNESRWSGMMGELTRREADIGGTSLFLIKERIDLIDYIAMITPTRSKFVFRQPKLSYITNVYTLPFDKRVWYSTIFMVVLMTLALFGLMKWEWTVRKLFKIDNFTNSLELSDSLPEVAFMTFGAVCQQGAVALPYSMPGRIATIFLLISLMFIYVSYSANIVALLQTSSNSIKTLEDLLKSRIDIGVDDTVYNRYYFSTADEPIRKAIYEKKVAPPGKPANYMPIEEGVKRVKDGLFAFNMETGSGYKLVSETFREDEKCGLQEIPYLQVVDPWFAIQKNSSYKEMLKIGLRLLRENGIQQRENYLIYTRKPYCTSKSSTFFSVGMVDCYPAVAILAGGMVVSAAVFILEIYLHNRIIFYKKQWHQHFDHPTYEADVKEDLIYQVFQTVSKVKRNSQDVDVH
nr:ionotropic receptor 75s [Pachyrhinus yasumatsui]